MLKMIDIVDNNQKYDDEIIKDILLNNSLYLDTNDINYLDKIGYFERKKAILNKKIEMIKAGVKNEH